jgi:hypothetical protein
MRHLAVWLAAIGLASAVHGVSRAETSRGQRDLPARADSDGRFGPPAPLERATGKVWIHRQRGMDMSDATSIARPRPAPDQGCEPVR